MVYKNLSFLPQTTFLVTGGAGFIGSNLCEAILNLGCKVRCLDNLSTGKKENVDIFINNSNYEFEEGDIRDYKTCLKACCGVDYVLHQAAWGSVPRSIELPLLYEEINIKGSLNMLDAAYKNKVKKFIYASSSSVYGDEASLPKKEGREGTILSPYALTKKTNEEYAKLYYKLYGFATIGLRYFNVFGRRQDAEGAYAAVIPRFIKLLLEDKQPVIFGDGAQSRDFTYIENVIESNLKACLAKSSADGQVFNIAFGGREYLLDIYNTLRRILGKDIEPLFEKERKGDIRHSNADITKAKELLGYNPEFDFKKGIIEAIEWYKENIK